MTKIAFLVNDLTVMGGSTKVTYQLANAWVNPHQVQIIGLFQSQSSFPFPLSSDVSTSTLCRSTQQIHEIKTYRHFIKTGHWKPCFQLVQTLFSLTRQLIPAKKRLSHLLEDTEIIIIPDVYGLYFLPSRFLKEKKIVVHLHNTVSFLVQNPLIMKTLTRYQSYIDQFVLLTQSDCQAFQSLGFSQSTSIYNEVSLPLHLDFPRSQPSSHKLVFLGRLDTRKGVEQLVPLMQQLLVQCPTAQLHVYGTGPEQSQLEQAIQTAKLTQHIILHGHTDSLDVVFEDASCFWLTSKWEGLPLTLLEAFAYGVPAIAFRCFDGIDEILIPQVGYAVPTHDLSGMVAYTQTLLTSSTEWSTFSQSAHHHAHQFHSQTIHQEWNRLFDSLLSKDS